MAGRLCTTATGFAAILLAAGTIQRNSVFSSRLTIWADTVQIAPENSRAHNNLGSLLQATGDLNKAEYHSRMNFPNLLSNSPIAPILAQPLDSR